ncbi:MAG: hypothetical protein K2O70_05305 [Desulfovibrionaceae bacterium]|nr:hypothetical protein [Desulfovibrionaceae bacterium]
MAAYSYVNYPGDGETRIYAVPFPFMERGYVHVRLLDGLSEREIPR